jgi:hypothetical protein
MKAVSWTVGCLGALFLLGCSDHHAEQVPSPEQRDLAQLKGEVQRLNREMEWLHQQLTSQQNRLEISQTAPLEQSYNPLRFQGLERKVIALESALDAVGRDVKALHGSAQETASLLRRVQQEGLGTLEKRVADLARMRGDVQQLVKALDGDHAVSAEVGSQVRVKAGDTLEKIARQQGCTVEALRRANRLKNDRIQVGQQLHLP